MAIFTQDLGSIVLRFFAGDEPKLGIGGNQVGRGTINPKNIIRETRCGSPDGNSDSCGNTFAASPASICPPSGLVGWWPGDGNANDLLAVVLQKGPQLPGRR